MEFRLKFSVKDETCVSSAANVKKARKEKKGVENSLTPRKNSNIHHLKLILFGIEKGKLEINISLHFNAPNKRCFQDFLLVFSLSTLTNYFFHHRSKYEQIAVRVCFFFSVFFHNDERSYITPSSFFCTLVHPVQNAMLSLSIY